MVEFAEGRLSSAVHWLGKASARGDPAAEALLGRILLAGRCVPKNYARAIALLRTAAADGETSAMCGLVSAYQYGWGVQRNFAEAHRWALAASERGSVWALAELGSMYLHGYGVEKDRKKACDLFLASAKRGSALAMLSVATCYAHGWGVGRSCRTELTWLLAAAVAGKHKYIRSLHWSRPREIAAIALVRLGEMYERGRGAKLDRSKAETCYRRAAALGSARALNNLAYLYQNWPDRPGLHGKAIKLFRMAAARGCAGAALNLAECYQRGIGIKKSRSAAVKWYARARQILLPRAARGRRSAESMLAMTFLEGTPKQSANTIPLLARLAGGGDPKYEMLHGAWLLAEGRLANNKVGIAWVRRAAQAGYAPAMKMLATAYAHGLWGLRRSPANANRWRGKAKAGTGVRARLSRVGGRDLLPARRPNRPR